MLTMPTEVITLPYGACVELPLIYTPLPPVGEQTATAMANVERATLSYRGGLHTDSILADIGSAKYQVALCGYAMSVLRFKAQRELARFQLEAGPSVYLMQAEDLTIDQPAILHCLTPLMIPLRMHLEELHEKLCLTPLPGIEIVHIIDQTAQLRACTDFIAA